MEEELIEQELWELVPLLLHAQSLAAALGRIERAIALRRGRQGDAHPDLIWALSLKIELLSKTGEPRSLRAAIAAGEERLRLRRNALEAVPSELLESLEELRCLYHWGGESHDAQREEELAREASSLRAGLRGRERHGR